MRLHTLSPAPGSRKKGKRLGRGIGSGLGKTSGRGHKGQKSRSGGYHKVGFEGGQMPLQRRLPKFGFTSHKGRVTEQVTLTEIANLEESIITFDLLKEKGLIRKITQYAKIFASGKIEKPVTIKGLTVTAGAKLAIEQAGGAVE
ncbi:MAG: 50S ribosomal protein L15 [Legionellales bacterium]|jgi:large subunit ribosomal protein L15